VLEATTFYKPFMPQTQQTPAQAAINLIAVNHSRPWLAVALPLAFLGLFVPTQAVAWFGTDTQQHSGPNEWEGTVVRVSDGDTVAVRALKGNKKPIKVRISGIDAPEICQQGGIDSRDVLQRRIMGQRVTVQGKKQDDYGRLLAQIKHKNDDVGLWMVSQGQAWSYRYNASVNPYAAEQRKAKATGQGVFKAGQPEQPIEPRIFRRKNKSCYQ